MHRFVGMPCSVGMLCLLTMLCASCARSSPAAGAEAPPPSASHPALGSTVSFALPNDEGLLTSVPGAARATVLDFWATTCQPCALSVPEIERRRGALSEENIALHFVAVLDSGESLTSARETLAAWMQAAALDPEDTPPFLADRQGSVQRSLALSELPATVILDSEGVTRWVAPVGARSEQIERAALWVAARY